MIAPFSASDSDSGRKDAFTLVEVLVSTAVLLLILLAVTLLFNGALVAIGLNNKHTDADAQARIVFDRMAVDFAQMIRRPDVDYYLKDATNQPMLGNGQVPGNDQLAFYSQVPGFYFPPASSPAPAASPTPYPIALQSPVSLVAYRINADTSSGVYAYNKLQRLGYGLVWNGSVPNVPAVVFSPQSTSIAPNTISTNWPSATGAFGTITNYEDSHYELASAQVFRFEYYYLLRGQIVAGTGGSPNTVLPPVASTTPWDVRSGVAHTSVNGLCDVSAVVVTIALTDPRTRLLTTDTQLAALASKMEDDDPSVEPAAPNSTAGVPPTVPLLQTQWQTAVSQAGPQSTVGLSQAVIAGIRIYRRYFYLPQNPTP